MISLISVINRHSTIDADLVVDGFDPFRIGLYTGRYRVDEWNGDPEVSYRRIAPQMHVKILDRVTHVFDRCGGGHYHFEVATWCGS